MILKVEVEKLAQQLHKFYRATHKVLNGPCAAVSHDHRWKACNKKAYFLRRAKSLATTMNNRDVSKLPRHMQSIEQADYPSESGYSYGQG